MKEPMKKQNCWEFMKCGREGNIDDSFFSEVGTCPAFTELWSDGVNDGKNAGRACWVVAGTFCGDSIQGDFASKIQTCYKCEFYKHVKEEEGNKLVTGSELIEIMQYKEEILLAKLNNEERRAMKLKKSTLVERLVTEMADFTDEGTSNKVKMKIARDTVNLFFDSIKESLQQGDRVEIRGFGSFHVKDYDAYTGRNPKTGATVKVQPKKLPVFRPGRELKKLVDK